MIKISNLTKRYKSGKGVYNLEFSVNAGDVFGYLGPNGAGKTTTIRQLLGFMQPDEGLCSIKGLDCWKEAHVIQQILGYMPEESAFFEDMTGTGFLNFMDEMRSSKSNSRRKHLIERFELDPSAKTRKMSKGMRQKLGLIAAFMHDPEVYILDEPTSGLDPLMQNTFLDLVLEEKQRGKTILMSSHRFEEIERTSDRAGIIKEGKLATVEDVHLLKSSQRRIYIVTVESEADIALIKDSGLEIGQIDRNRIEIVVTGGVSTLYSGTGKMPCAGPGCGFAEPRADLHAVLWPGGKHAMNWTLFKYTFRSNWMMGLIFFAILLMYLGIIVSMYDPENLEAMSAMLEMLPPEMVNALGYGMIVTDMTTFIASYYFGFIIVLFPMVYVIMLGNRLVAKHVDHGSMTYLLSTPHTRTSIATTQGVYLAVSSALLIAIIGATGLAISEGAFPGDLDIGAYLKLALGAMLLLVSISSICFFFSCLFNDSKYSLALGGGIPVVFFLVSMLAGMSGSYDWLKYMTIFTLYEPASIISGEQVNIARFVGLLGISTVLYVSGVVIFRRKDLPL